MPCFTVFCIVLLQFADTAQVQKRGLQISGSGHNRHGGDGEGQSNRGWNERTRLDSKNSTRKCKRLCSSSFQGSSARLSEAGGVERHYKMSSLQGMRY